MRLARQLALLSLSFVAHHASFSSGTDWNRGPKTLIFDVTGVLKRSRRPFAALNPC